MSGLVTGYVLLAIVAALHAGHRLWLLALYLRHRGAVSRPRLPEDLPHVTVQLPVYNERDVVERLVRAVAALDWPADRLEIQLLDDSDDDTGDRARGALEEARGRGIPVLHLRREDRAGFKAGALAVGLERARGELIAIFDADFVPAPDFLRALVPWFADPRVGMVQARWGHLNAGTSWLTRAQAALLDGHFLVEHSARHRSGRWFNFNGTAGVWRRTCIEDAGGWRADTLTEDLDLSYRAQLAGWNFVYDPEHVVPAELPERLSAFRSQQHRWAKGSIEVARKLVRPIVGAGRFPLSVRLEAVAHLTANLSWPFGLALAVLLPVLVLVMPEGTPAALAPLLGVSTLVNLGFYAVSTRWRPWDVVLAVLLGLGLAVNQTLAVAEGLMGRRTAFIRTPKSGGGRGSYRLRVLGPVPVEIALGVLALVAATRGGGAAPFLVMFAVAFGAAGIGGALERFALKGQVRWT